MYTPKPNLRWSQVPVWVRVTWLLFALDAVSYYVVSIAVGGDAAKGFQQEGKYFLTGSVGVTEVSRTVYYYSYLQLSSIAVLFFLSIVGSQKVLASIKKDRLQ